MRVGAEATNESAVVAWDHGIPPSATFASPYHFRSFPRALSHPRSPATSNVGDALSRTHTAAENCGTGRTLVRRLTREKELEMAWPRGALPVSAALGAEV